MKKLENLIKKLENFDIMILNIIEKTIKEYEHIIIDMNVENQLFERGINNEGTTLKEIHEYAPLTITIKKSKGQPTNRVTLRDEGDFHSSFKIEYKSNGFTIYATDIKTEELEGKYGEEIFGLTDENFNYFAENYIKPAILTELRT